MSRIPDLLFAVVMFIVIWVGWYGLKYGANQKKKEPICICKSAQEIIALHEKRSYFIDRLSYPNKELTKKEQLALTDSITKYTIILNQN